MGGFGLYLGRSTFFLSDLFLLFALSTNYIVDLRVLEKMFCGSWHALVLVSVNEEGEKIPYANVIFFFD